ncbi:MAG: long-chain fatty acid--CoA ligase [Rhodospirillales bacterium]|nr:long-chain fatty acid--CoA ligase [Rhodospirillales bacterium]
MYLTQGLRRAAQIKPRGVSTVFRGRRHDWTTSLERVARLAGGLRALGIGAADRIAILALNSDRYLELMYAIPWIGAAMVPLNTRLATPETEYILEDSGSVALFVDGAMRAHAEALAGKMPALKAVIWLDDDAPPAGMRAYEDLLSAGAVDDAGAGGETLAGLFYTGGTTGKSKGVMLSHANLTWNAMNAIAGIGFDGDTVYLHSGPMFHLADGASSFGVTQCGGTHAFVARFDPVDCLTAIQAEKVTHGQYVPTMINMLCNHPRFAEFDVSSLKRILYGASPMPEGVLLKALEVLPGCGFIHAYGMTEAAPILTLLPTRYTTLDGPYAGRLKSCGQPAHTVDLRIVDADRKEVPRGTVGEIAAKGPMIMLGYWNKPAETAAVLEDGWYYSGDGGTMDDEGFVFIVDRLKDMIVSGGENVYSAEVESAITLMPAVAEVAVIGIPDEKWGETVHAVVVPRPGAEVTPEQVLAHCRTRIAGYKCPRSVEIRTTSLPLSGAGKVLKRDLREPYWKGYAKRVN